MSLRLGVILAGGRAERLEGCNKALLRMNGERLADRAARVLKPLVDEIVIGGPDPVPLGGIGLPFLPDAVGFAGPLAGIVAGIRSCPEEFFVLGVDQVGVTVATFERLQSSSIIPGVAALSSGGYVHPTVLHMRCACFPAAESALAGGCRSAIALLEKIGFAAVDALEGECADVDTEDDLERLAIKK